MAEATRARLVAVDLLREQRTRSARARELLRASGGVSALPGRDRAFSTSLVLGVVRTSGALDGVIGTHLRRGMHLEPRVRDSLRLSTYELLFLSTPVRVAVSQGVELVRRVSPRAAGLANAVLRRIAEQDVPRMAKARARVEAGGCDVRDLALVSGLPIWLVHALGMSLAEGELNWFVRMQVAPPPVYVAGNLARHDAPSFGRLLSDAGLGARPTGLPLSYVLHGGGELARTGLVQSCEAVPCDLGAQTVALACAPAPRSRVLEVGQGRGTKTILLENAAISAGGPAEVVALDSQAFKVELSRQRMERAGLSAHVSCLALDGRSLAWPDLPDLVSGSFDLVLVDAPCSGTGTMRRHPEIAWSLGMEDVASGGSLPRLQTELLSAAAARVAPGGALVYSTCSALRSEDEEVVASFLGSSAGRGFSVARIAQAPVGTITSEGYLRTVAPGLDCDAHFCARLERHS